LQRLVLCQARVAGDDADTPRRAPLDIARGKFEVCLEVCPSVMPGGIHESIR
jgi:hypothetical protein